MAHQSLNCPEIIPIVEKRRGECMPHYVGMDSLLNESLFWGRFDEGVNRGRVFLPVIIFKRLVFLGRRDVSDSIRIVYF